MQKFVARMKQKAFPQTESKQPAVFAVPLPPLQHAPMVLSTSTPRFLDKHDEEPRKFVTLPVTGTPAVVLT
jgi:hypothetical protein